MASIPAEAAPTRSKKTLWLAIVVIMVVLAVGGIAAYVLLAPSPNQPPVAAFTYVVDGLALSVNAAGSTDPDGEIASYAWSWGDGATGSGRSATHTYAFANVVTVVLTVTDNGGATGDTSRSIQLEDRPAARFTLDRDLMHVDVDASASQARNGTIASYAWDWGDGTPGASGVTAAHDYRALGKYDVTLNVTDSRGSSSTAVRIASVANSTVDVTMSGFFEIPYAEWWYSLRGPVYGDYVLENSTPYTNLYPWAGDLNDTFVHTNFRETIRGRNLSGYSVANPVFFPVLNASVAPAPGATADVDWYLQYIDTPRKSQLTASGWFISAGWMDGFLSEWTMSVTMDYNTSRRAFNVTGDPAAWWTANTVSGPNQGWLDNLYGNWLETQGKDTLDVWNAFEWYYTAFYIDVSATVRTNPDGSNTTVAKVYLISWGQEVLIARWFYWGSGTYPDGTPNGWRKEEVGWFEDMTFNGTLSDHLDLDLTGVMGYQFVAIAHQGSDGLWRTPDDVPMWVWYPQLMDYIYSVPAHPKSELDRWTGLQKVNAHPGTPYYGQPFQIDFAYVAWDLVAGETITIIMPTGDIRWYDPYTSYWDATRQTPNFYGPDGIRGTADDAVFLAPAKFRGIIPSGVGYWDDATMTGYVAGPATVGGGNPPLDGLPRFEFVPRI